MKEDRGCPLLKRSVRRFDSITTQVGKTTLITVTIQKLHFCTTLITTANMNAEALKFASCECKSKKKKKAYTKVKPLCISVGSAKAVRGVALIISLAAPVQLRIKPTWRGSLKGRDSPLAAVRLMVLLLFDSNKPFTFQHLVCVCAAHTSVLLVPRECFNRL